MKIIGMLAMAFFASIGLIGRALGFIAKMGVMVFESKQPYIQGFGGADYSKSKPYKAPVSRAMPVATVDTPPSPVAAAKAVDKSEADPLVLRTAMEMIDQNQLKERPPVLVAARTLIIPLAAQTNLPIGKAWVYLYEQEKIARRVMKIQNPHLARLICGANEDRYFFKDVEYIADKGTKPIVDQFLKEIQGVLQRKKVVQQNGPVVVKPMEPKPAAAPNPQPVPKQEMEKASSAPTVTPPPARVDRSVTGVAHQGVVVFAAPTRKNPHGRKSYTTFCLTINNGEREIPLYGTEIERQVMDMNILVGDRVKVIDMGKEDISVPGEEPRHRNLYQVTRIGAN